ncbi:MAG: phenylacetate--CoA ligase family protein [Deltaproteobacteria bacterium]|nr:phenylacetate--CoA ligase family protein [Deltaproteobacteria bacterium]
MGLAKLIYSLSPAWLQTAMVTAQGFVFNHRRMDVRLARRLLAERRESQWWDEDRFQRYQEIRLRDHITFAATHIPYYKGLFKSLGMNPRDVRTVEDLGRLPLLEKSVIRKSPDAFLWGGKRSRSWNKLFTSGTTGSPMELFSSRESFTRSWSFVFRLREWTGLNDPIFPRRAQFTGRNIIPDKRIEIDRAFWRRNFAGNALLMSTTHLSQDTVEAYAEAIGRFSPELVDGYPSAIQIVARFAMARALELPSPRAIITSAETLVPDDRRVIESAFGCKVFNQYASSDTGAFICDCEEGNLHLNPEFGICEILTPEGRPARPGEEGEIVTTSFCNTEQVFIRYKIGDLAVRGPDEKCPCGRMMPRIEAVTGRVDDILFIPERGFVGRLDPIFKSLNGIWEAQIVQESLERLRVKVVPEPGFDGSSRAALEASLHEKVGPDVDVVIDEVKEIPRGPNGKFQSVISLCKDRYPRMA